jgi:hypothetical protein
MGAGEELPCAYELNCVAQVSTNKMINRFKDYFVKFVFASVVNKTLGQ